MPMEQHYEWTFGAPGAGLHVHMENFERHGAADAPLFDATLTLRRQPMTALNLAGALARFPLIPLRVCALIYWQALKLWLKRTPFHAHPHKQTAT
jgi:DUF1365 family protein